MEIKDIKKKYEEILSDEKTETVVEKVKETAEKVKDAAERVKDVAVNKVKTAAEKVKDKFHDYPGSSADTSDNGKVEASQVADRTAEMNNNPRCHK